MTLRRLLLAILLLASGRPAAAQSDSGFSAWARGQIVPFVAGRPPRALWTR